MAAHGNASTAEHAGVPHHSHVGRYVVVWIVLLVLTVSTWAIAKVHLPGPLHILVALVIAIAKGALVALFFMHLYDQQGANRLVFATSLVFVALLVGLTLSDYATRYPLAKPPGSEGALPAPDYAPPPTSRTH
ncbi:cytochrome C oxidase subunit IV family protein [Anaeromyxobacter terrae]|uniref:cytochrome C oxidase subunit IV family protein n=1 Tax=Anaeromyxobacter terrae TaxID=2925406 RepID=UPI001F571F40|nr:cytochrome C oxidase subunit IV family protein [Anaeromyxobacter sp. SG22]